MDKGENDCCVRYGMVTSRTDLFGFLEPMNLMASDSRQNIVLLNSNVNMFRKGDIMQCVVQKEGMKVYFSQEYHKIRSGSNVVERLEADERLDLVLRDRGSGETLLVGRWQNPYISPKTLATGTILEGLNYLLHEPIWDLHPLRRWIGVETKRLILDDFPLIPEKNYSTPLTLLSSVKFKDHPNLPQLEARIDNELCERGYAK